MKKSAIIASAAMLFGSLQAYQNIAVVNFTDCIMESKFGKKEQQSFESMKSQMTSLITDIDKQLREVSKKLQDPEHMDSLSPEAEKELKMQFQSLNEEMQRYQNQYMQVMNQANMKLVQLMTGYVSAASSKVAKAKDIEMVVNKDACFYYEPKLDITTNVIQEMDSTFDKDAPKQSQEEKK